MKHDQDMFLTIFPDNMATLRRSKRQTRGEGGTAAQLERVGEAIKYVPKEKRHAVANIPDTSLANPMAPVTTKRRGPPKKQTSITPLVDLGTAPSAPQYIVPPGTEPSLTVPTLGFHAYGHEYGFPVKLMQTVKPHNALPKLDHSHSTTKMVIDPSLLNLSEPSGSTRTRVVEGSRRGLYDKVDSDEESDEESTEEGSDEDGDEDKDENGDQDKDEDSDEDKYFEAKDNAANEPDHNTIEGLDTFDLANYDEFEDELGRGLEDPVNGGFGFDDGGNSAADGKSQL